jgi:hypothetical protein
MHSDEVVRSHLSDSRPDAPQFVAQGALLHTRPMHAASKLSNQSMDIVSLVSAPGLLCCPAGTIWRGNEVIEGVLQSLELLRQLVGCSSTYARCASC